MASLQLNLHPGLIPRKEAPWRKRHRTPHLHQGDMDGACGNACVFMAMILMRIATWREIKLMRHMTGDRLEKTFLLSLETHFAGASDLELGALLDTLAEWTQYQMKTGSSQRVCKFAVERLANDELIILGLNPSGSLAGHWVLAVGTECSIDEDSQTHAAILCLDPAEPSPLVAPFNAALNTASQGKGRLTYLTLGASRLITCRVAFALSARIVP